MSLLRSLCCRPSTQDIQDIQADNIHGQPSDDGAHRSEKSTTDAEVSKLPVPPSQFVKHCNGNEHVLIWDLLRPYLEYEQSLRRDFAHNDKKVDGLANLIPIYAGGNDADKVTARNSERKKANKEKYIMRLSESQVGDDGSPAIAPSLDEYKRNSEAFTHCE